VNKPDISVAALLERIESEAEIADGRTVRLCRDANGSLWIVDDAERVVPLREFAGHCSAAARQLAARERVAALRRRTARVTEALVRIARAIGQVAARVPATDSRK